MMIETFGELNIYLFTKVMLILDGKINIPKLTEEMVLAFKLLLMASLGL